MDKLGIYAYCGFQVTAEERFRAIAKAGFQNVAVWCDCDFNTGSGITEYEQFKFVQENSLNVVYAHAPTKLAPYLSNMYYGKKEAVKTHKIWIKGAAEKNIKILVIHTPQITGTVIDNLAEIAQFAEEQGVKLAVENLIGEAPFDELFNAVPNIYFCYDSCHALMYGDAEGRMIDRYADRLICTHLSDGDGTADCHWMIGDGKMDFHAVADRLKIAGYKGSCTLEVFQSSKYTDISEFLTIAKQRAEQLFAIK